MENAKLISLNFEEGSEARFDFNSLDENTLDEDGLYYVIGYIAGFAFSKYIDRTGDGGRVFEVNREEPSHGAGYLRGKAVRDGKDFLPAWHTEEISMLIILTRCSGVNMTTLLEILHDRAVEAGVHKCRGENDQHHLTKVPRVTGSGVLRA